MAGYYGNIKRKLLRDTMSEVTGIIRIRKFRKMYITMPEHLYITKKKKKKNGKTEKKKKKRRKKKKKKKKKKRTSKRYHQKKFEADEESHYQKH